MFAYELDRRNEALFTVWPGIEAGRDEPDKARVLFQRGLEEHPQSTRIMALYAQVKGGCTRCCAYTVRVVHNTGGLHSHLCVQVGGAHAHR